MIASQSPRTEKQQIDRRFGLLHRVADVIHDAQTTHIGQQQLIMAIGIQFATLGQQPVARLFRPTHDVEARVACVSRQLLGRGGADAVGAADEHGDERGGEALGDLPVGRANGVEVDHVSCC